MARSGARVPRRLGLSHVVRYDLKVVLILLDGWEGCMWVKRRKDGTDTPRRLGVAHVGKDGLKVVLILLDSWEGFTWVRRR